MAKAKTAPAKKSAAGELRKKATAASRQVKSGAKKVDGFARKNPWAVAGAAAGLGLVVGLLSRPRRKKKR